jgi:small subunit ribosomal protein S16
MLKIRLQRVGRKHEPSFRLVLTDSKNSTKSGRFGEILGSYDPRKSLESLKAERITYWISKGAGVTGTVNNLLIKKGIVKGKKTHVGMDNVVKAVEEKPAPEAAVEEAASAETPVEAPAEAPVEETPAVEPAPEAAPAEV